MLNDEEPGEVHGCLRRNAEQDRRLMKIPHNKQQSRHISLNFGGFKYMTMKKNLIKSMTEIGQMRSRIGD